MKASSLTFSRGSRPVFLSFLAAAAAVAGGPPGVLREVLEQDGVVFTADLVRSRGGRWLLETELTNRTARALYLPGGLKENGLSFALTGPAGERVLDGAPPSFTEEVRLLAPGASLRSQIDLSRRPLVLAAAGAEGPGTRVEGVLSPALAGVAYLDLVVRQRAGRLEMATAPMRLHLGPSVYSGTSARDGRVRAAFAALYPDEDGVMKPLPWPGYPDPDDGVMKPLGGPGKLPVGIFPLPDAPEFISGERLVTLVAGGEGGPSGL